ncbi:MAG: ribonuclease H-like domain-containing protein [Flavobacteriales bacterium]|nr:ribonuclease H-like domain-containing protein [Flavobacteriales bacterium]
MLDNLKLNKVIFIDIETVSQQKEFSLLSIEWKSLWERKSTYLANEDETPESIYNRAGIYAEFGKVICISIGIFRDFGDHRVFRIKSFYGKNEKEVLGQFCDLFTKSFQSTDHLLCAHNGKEFDFPFLARRILVNGLKLPFTLDIAGRKPWEVQHLDTLQLWKFGDFKHYTSLKLLCELFNIDSPKNDMDGSDVGRVFWEEDNLDKIVKYCRNDTLAVAQLLLVFKGLDQIKDSEVEIID